MQIIFSGAWGRPPLFSLASLPAVPRPGKIFRPQSRANRKNGEKKKRAERGHKKIAGKPTKICPHFFEKFEKKGRVDKFQRK